MAKEAATLRPSDPRKGVSRGGGTPARDEVEGGGMKECLNLLLYLSPVYALPPCSAIPRHSLFPLDQSTMVASRPE